MKILNSQSVSYSANSIKIKTEKKKHFVCFLSNYDYLLQEEDVLNPCFCSRKDSLLSDQQSAVFSFGKRTMEPKAEVIQSSTVTLS